MLSVVKREKESVDQMLRRFKNKFKDSGLAKEFFEKQFFVKPSQLKKERRRLALVRKKRVLAENE
jgi:ribosomal protein S21